MLVYLVPTQSRSLAKLYGDIIFVNFLTKLGREVLNGIRKLTVAWLFGCHLGVYTCADTSSIGNISVTRVTLLIAWRQFFGIKTIPCLTLHIRSALCFLSCVYTHTDTTGSVHSMWKQFCLHICHRTSSLYVCQGQGPKATNHQNLSPWDSRHLRWHLRHKEFCQLISSFDLRTISEQLHVQFCNFWITDPLCNLGGEVMLLPFYRDCVTSGRLSMYNLHHVTLLVFEVVDRL